MRKDIAKFIKKTEHRLHRSNGKVVLDLPAGMNNSKLTAAKICGNTAIGQNFTANGVGDYDEENQKYKITLRIHGTNYLSGDDYRKAHLAKVETVSNSYSDDFYTTIVDKNADGTVFIDNSIIKFKENTVYTLCSLFQYQTTSSTDRNLGICFNYSDGTSRQMRMATTSQNFTYCIPSDEGKTIVSIASDTGERLYTKISMSKFGIFEGNHTNYDDVFEAFCGEIYSILIDKPLLKIGVLCDELDIVTGKIKRRINSFKIATDTAVSESESEGIFKVYLPKAMRENSACLCEYRKMSFEELQYYNKGITESSCGNFIYIKNAELFPDIESFRTYISENPIFITYVMKNYEEEISEVDIPYRSGKTVIEVHTSVSPNNFYAEYF